MSDVDYGWFPILLLYQQSIICQHTSCKHKGSWKKKLSVGLFYGIRNAEKVGKYEFDKSYV